MMPLPQKETSMTTEPVIDTGAATAPTSRKPRAATAAPSTTRTTAKVGKSRPPNAATLPSDPPVAPSLPSKLDRLATLLADPAGATIAVMSAATGWQAHSVRGAIAGALRKRGLVVTSTKVDGVRFYRAGPAA